MKTFTFKDEECANAKPGQFLMLWIPGVDEIPLSISAVDEDSVVSVAVKNVGEATKALHGKKIGDIVGVRGPFGNSFTETGKKVLMVGGGTGMAPLSFLAESILPKATRMIFVLGAKTRNELVFRDRLTQALHGNRTRLIMSTEDGTCGITGLCTDPLEGILKEEKLDIVYACGPERMILKIFELTERHGMSLEVSLERLMRCAMGLCGSCVIGRYRVCRDGPVFTGEQLREVQAEFGLWKRDFDGRRIPL